MLRSPRRPAVREGSGSNDGRSSRVWLFLARSHQRSVAACRPSQVLQTEVARRPLPHGPAAVGQADALARSTSPCSSSRGSSKCTAPTMPMKRVCEWRAEPTETAKRGGAGGYPIAGHDVWRLPTGRDQDNPNRTERGVGFQGALGHGWSLVTLHPGDCKQLSRAPSGSSLSGRNSAVPSRPRKAARKDSGAGGRFRQRRPGRRGRRRPPEQAPRSPRAPGARRGSTQPSPRGIVAGASRLTGSLRHGRARAAASVGARTRGGSSGGAARPRGSRPEGTC